VAAPLHRPPRTFDTPLPFRVRPLALALTGLLASSLANAQSSTAVAVRDATATLADQA
jgi:hypothetical protein